MNSTDNLVIKATGQRVLLLQRIQQDKMGLVKMILYALLGATCYGLPEVKNENKLTSQDLLDIIANSDNPDIKSLFASGFVKQKENKQVNKNNTEYNSKVQSVQRTTAGQITTTAITPNIGVSDLNQNIRPASSGNLLGPSINSLSLNGQGYQHRPLYNYGPGDVAGAAQASIIQSGQVVHGSHVADTWAIEIQRARATEAAAELGKANAVHNAQTLDVARAGTVLRARQASLEFARAAEAARRAAAVTAVELARAQEAGRIANAAHFQANRIANAARNSLAIAAAWAAGPVQLSNIVNSATLAIQAARETEAVARARQATAIRNAQAAMRVSNVQRAQAAVWVNTRAAENARQAAAGTAAEMARAAEAERVAYAARVRANTIANMATAQSMFARNTQQSARFYGGYGPY